MLRVVSLVACIFLTSGLTLSVKRTDKVDKITATNSSSNLSQQPRVLAFSEGQSVPVQRDPSPMTFTSNPTIERDCSDGATIASTMTPCNDSLLKSNRNISTTAVGLSKGLTAVAEGVQLSFDGLSLSEKDSVPKVRNANPAVVPRKGVFPNPGLGPENYSFNGSAPIKVNSTDPIQRSDANSTNSIHNLKSNVFNSTLLPSKGNVSTNLNAQDHKDLNIAVIPVNNADNRSLPLSTPATTKVPKKHKPKPTVTIGEADIDKPIPASPTKSPPLGMPRKIDYIVPVVITILAVPLLGVAMFILYKRGRDCWDKRHYRRMDFLIDGMYND
ncbi:uncharacterized protein LOC105699353 [Orussus abietinus]|uniref:uncharacterized protein LOC105699353 n=1 Tax=Orussus abietinus TaxID=222816 RepID=UPI000625B8BD|nr:uncharacterized protein LOC105699353 [Orussus abietinus]